jgi:hypothetical protein
MPQGTPPSAFFRTLGATQAVGVSLQLGMNDWDALESKAGRVAVLDELFLRYQFNYTEANAAVLALTYQVISLECTGISFQTRTGREIMTGLDGEFLSLQHILSRELFADVRLAASGASAGYHKVPLWMGTYPFDLEEYPLAVADCGAMQEARGGGSIANDTLTTLTQQPIARGRFLQEAPTKRREWFRVYAADEVHLPRGRYHAIFIVNPKSADGNLYNDGLTVTGPDIAINAVDGRDLQRAFLEDYGQNFIGSFVAAELATLQLDACAGAAGDVMPSIEDLMQPVYWGGEDSMRWESGVNGPITIRSSAADPSMAVYCLRCVE